MVKGEFTRAGVGGGRGQSTMSIYNGPIRDCHLLLLLFRYIDIDKVISVQEVTASQQDKNHATFTVQCDGRTFQMQAHDETSMRK